MLFVGTAGPKTMCATRRLKSDGGERPRRLAVAAAG